MRVGGWDYLFVFLAGLAISLTLTPLAVRVANRRGVLDHPGGHKGHSSPIPYLGGVAIATAFAAIVIVATSLRPPVSGRGELWAILGLAVGLSFVGLVDDLRGLGPIVRLLFEIAAAVAVVFTGTHTQLFGDLDVLDGVITVVWIVGVTNAFNLLDNMDGLSAGAAAIGAFFFFVIGAANGQFLVATLAIALAGCAAGFLRHNFHPARIYMGDSGSLFLGFLLAVIGLKLRFDGPTEVTFFVPILVLGVALFDTTLVTATRLIHRRSPFLGGRDHTSHRLVFVGLPVPVAVSLIYAVAVSLGWLGLIMSRVDRGTGFLLMALVLTVGAFLGVLLAVVPVYETSRRRHLMIQEVDRHEPDPADEPLADATA